MPSALADGYKEPYVPFQNTLSIFEQLRGWVGVYVVVSQGNKSGIALETIEEN